MLSQYTIMLCVTSGEAIPFLARNSLRPARFTFNSTLSILATEMPPKRRQLLWDELQAKMSGKRTKTDAHNKQRNKGSAPNEIVVQKLSSEADSRQTYRPIQPREFVEFAYEDLTLTNLKDACATHFNFPAASCDVLVSNKGPSCTNISQIPHRKDRV